MSLGMVVRDNMGRVVAAKCLMVLGHLDPAAAEALGAYHATLFSQEVGVNQLILEGDAQQVVIAVNSGVSQDFRYGQLVEDTRTIFFLRSFVKWECRHVCRQFNGGGTWLG